MDLQDISGLGLEEEIRKYNETMPRVLLALLGKRILPNHVYLTKPNSERGSGKGAGLVWIR